MLGIGEKYRPANIPGAPPEFPDSAFRRARAAPSGYWPRPISAAGRSFCEGENDAMFRTGAASDGRGVA